MNVDYISVSVGKKSLNIISFELYKLDKSGVYLNFLKNVPLIMPKILAIDFGLKRTGLALSDDSKIFAFGLKTVESKTLDAVVAELIQKEKVDEIVIGEPKRLDTSDSHITENVRMLKAHLEKKHPLVKIVLIDERFTSKMASFAISQSGLKKKDRQSKELIDEVSATIILQDYLQKRSF